MSELNDLPKDEMARLMAQARANLARRRPGAGVRSLAIGVGIPAVTLVGLMAAAPVWFTATLWHRLLYIALVALATGVGIVAAWQDRRSAILQEALRELRNKQ